METKALVYQNWDEIVFENRNKQYGAYTLRKSYNDKVLLGWGVSIMLLAILFFASDFFKDDVMITDTIIKETVVVLPPPPQIEKKIQDPPQQKEIKSQTPKKNLPPLISKTDSTEVDTTTQVVEPLQPFDDGVQYALGGDPNGSGQAVTLAPVNNDPIDIAEVMPEYEGGVREMMQFVQRKMRYPNAPRRLKVEGTVYVKFVVNGDGSVSDAQVIRGIHPDCDKEAVRVISMLPGWKGGKQGGRPVRVRMVLPIKFKIQE